MEDHVVLLNLLSLTWVAMDQASPLREAHKEQVCLLSNYDIVHWQNFYHFLFWTHVDTNFLREIIQKIVVV